MLVHFNGENLSSFVRKEQFVCSIPTVALKKQLLSHCCWILWLSPATSLLLFWCLKSKPRWKKCLQGLATGSIIFRCLRQVGKKRPRMRTNVECAMSADSALCKFASAQLLNGPTAARCKFCHEAWTNYSHYSEKKRCAVNFLCSLRWEMLNEVERILEYWEAYCIDLQGVDQSTTWLIALETLGAFLPGKAEFNLIFGLWLQCMPSAMQLANINSGTPWNLNCTPCRPQLMGLQRKNWMNSCQFEHALPRSEVCTRSG